MKATLPAIFALIAIYSAARAELPAGATLVQQISWAATKPADGVAHNDGPDGASYVTLTNADSKPKNLPLWSADAPAIHGKYYALLGKVRFHDVKGASYVELLNYFRDPAGPGEAITSHTYFTRTLSDKGPMAKLTGTSDWRPIALPFDASAAKAAPKRLDLDLVLAGAGTVDLTDMTLVEFASPAAMWAATGQPAPASK